MAYVPGFDQNIVIGYANVAEKRCVWGLREKLQEHLDRELRQETAASIFWYALYENRIHCEATINEFLINFATFVQLFGGQGANDGYESWLRKRVKATRQRSPASEYTLFQRTWI